MHKDRRWCANVSFPLLSLPSFILWGLPVSHCYRHVLTRSWKRKTHQPHQVQKPKCSIPSTLTFDPGN
ncbi:hypothetical protein AAZX31_02G037700 [Glycine max]